MENLGNLEWFGVALLHNHFELNLGEILLKTKDVSAREQYPRPVKKLYMNKNGVTAHTSVAVTMTFIIGVAAVILRH